MAAKKTGGPQDTKESSSPDRPATNSSNFDDFIAMQLQKQEKESRLSDNIDTEKRDNFIARARAESERMKREAEKSQAKRDRLHAELGEARLSQWRNEHAAEVLTGPQAALVEASFQQGKQM